MAESLANRLSNPNCVGENISPQLSWSNVPDGTKSFILLMSDPEGRGGTGTSHFVSYGNRTDGRRLCRRRSEQAKR